MISNSKSIRECLLNDTRGFFNYSFTALHPPVTDIKYTIIVVVCAS